MTDKFERAEYKHRPSNWFHEYVRRDREGTVTFENSPPFIRPGAVERLRVQIEKLYGAYELLFRDSAERTVQECYVLMNHRGIAPAFFQVPWPILPPILWGVPIKPVPNSSFYGAFSAEEFGQVQRLPVKPEIWKWLSEGPISTLARFGME